MPLRVDRARVERALRILGLAALALWIVNAARPRAGRVESATVRSLPDVLPRWTLSHRVAGVHVRMDTASDAPATAWLAALRRAGVAVSWTGATIGTVAIETYPAVDPAGGVFVLANAPHASKRVVSDAFGAIDTLAAPAAQSALRVAAVGGDVTLQAGAQVARAEVAPAIAPRRILVIGDAGWETKFVVAALEESGWAVDARLFVSPQHEVQQGGRARAALDTSRHAAIVLMDSASAERALGAERFARAGGGVVLAGDAIRARRLGALVAWRGVRRESAPLGTLPGDTAWRGLSRMVFDTIGGRRGIVLESRNGGAVVAVRRHYTGRVAVVGYDQTWRWRMAGGENSVAAHRDWWSRVVASVAARTPTPALDRADPTTSVAPLATLYSALGAPSGAVRAGSVALSPRATANLLGVVLFTSLLGEWLLRRARGAR
ncbi:MAG: hypothetical protein WD801_12890 [Gemmatimonadaceae bacterium]